MKRLAILIEIVSLANSRLQPVNRQRLVVALESLLQRLDNIMSFVARADEPNTTAVGQLAQQLLKAMSATDKSLVELKAMAASINGKHRR